MITTNPCRKLLERLAQFRVITPGQVHRLLVSECCLSADDAVRCLNQAVTRGVVVLYEVQLSRLAHGSDCGATICCLTQKGMAMVRRHLPRLAPFARQGIPEGALYKRIYHDLLTIEAFLYLLRRYNVQRLLIEGQIKSGLLQKRHKTSRTSSSKQIEATGDFRALCVERKDDERRADAKPIWIEAEISLCLDADQMEGKPSGLRWFVATTQKADIVETLTGTRPVVLDDVRTSVEEARVPDEVKPMLETAEEEALPHSVRENRIMKTLECMGGALTANALALILQTDRSGISRLCQQLIGRGAMFCTDVQLHPGRQRGRRQRLFALDTSEFDSLGWRQHRLLVSLATEEVNRHGYAPTHYSKETGTIYAVARVESTVKPHALVVVDDPRINSERLWVRYSLTLNSYSPQTTAIFVLPVNSERRSALCGKLRIAKSCATQNGCK